jgi:hypothetical protein
MAEELTPQNAPPAAPTTPNEPEIQRPWESRAIGFNMLMPALCLIPGVKPYIAANLEGVMALWGIINILLRTFSNQKITWIK